MKLTSAEWQLMNALWRGYPATARDLAERLDGALPPFLQAVLAGSLVMMVHAREGAEEPLDMAGLLQEHKLGCGGEPTKIGNFPL